MLYTLLCACSRTCEVVFVQWSNFKFSASVRVKIDWNVSWGRGNNLLHIVKNKSWFMFT